MTIDAFATCLTSTRRPVRQIAVLTGAGISAESGLPTFRGEDGLWQGRDPATFFTPESLPERPRECWELFDALRTRAAQAGPNDGHRALAALQQSHAVTLITQNIDGLHQRAGSAGVLELHGTLWSLSCPRCGHWEENSAAPLPELPPPCPSCRGILRPDVVMFSESLPERVISAAYVAAETCDLMLVVGTSGVVYPAAGLPQVARQHGAAVVEVNPAPTALSVMMDCVVRGAAAATLPAMVRLLQEG
jgi:NAD-dependent deacetylase